MRIFKFLPLILVLTLTGCMSMVDNEPENNALDKSAVEKQRRLSKEKALYIGNKVLKKISTRDANIETPIFDNVLNEASTRGISLPDTLAYILNYPNDGGFVIVAADTRVNPVLVYSASGNFSFDNEIAKENFIDKIGDYIDSSDSDNYVEFDEDSFNYCYSYIPSLPIYLSQGSPWNKYVNVEHPDCLVGCAPVAIAYVMCYCKVEYTYHNSVFHLKSMIEAINKGPESGMQNLKRRVVGGDDAIPKPKDPEQPVYSYEQAVDSMAKLLYWIGKDTDTQYGKDGSGTSSTNGFAFLNNLGLTKTNSAKYNGQKIYQYIRNNYINFMTGKRIEGGGHAWIANGAKFCVASDNDNEIIDYYILCDWGWGGHCNGYYNGNVFQTKEGDFIPVTFTAIKKEW